jgi:hypothetical protein
LKGGHVHREAINEVGIGICLIGNFEQTRPTPRQLMAFRELVDYLRADVVKKRIRFAVHRKSILPHRLPRSIFSNGTNAFSVWPLFAGEVCMMPFLKVLSQSRVSKP